ncbi:acyltransferase [Microbacterium sp. NPDC058342]|uniref:acyltransferase family protein n=1 Tax=Microbacterium sp. NPDC058342 TaxID=3346454 RepID=UPI003663FC53
MTSPSSSAPVPTRDRAIDLVRALCIIGVVVLHSLMAGVTLGPEGPVFANAGETGFWLVPVSWLLQVMPLFFVIGGFSGLSGLRAARRRGGSAAAFAASRVQRLLIPAVAAVGTAGMLLTLLRDAGVGDDLVEMAGYRFGQPLWFLGVFLLCQGLLPVMVHLHERAPLRTLGLLAAAALAVDVVRESSGIPAIGFLNLAFVWLALQQLGFLLADGRIDALPVRTRIAAAAGALALLIASFASGVHSPDLVANINPPTTALLLVGVVHTAAFSLLRPRLSALAARPRADAFISFVSARAMTIYLWHMPVVLTLAGVTAVIGLAAGLQLPVPASASWWLTRPLWLACVLAGTVLLAIPLARLERIRPPRGGASARRASAAVIIGAAGVGLLLAAGTTPTTALLAVGCWLLALQLTLTSPVPAPAPFRAAAVFR